MVVKHDILVIINYETYTNVDAVDSNHSLAEIHNATALKSLAIAMNEVNGILVHIFTDYIIGAEPYNFICKKEQAGIPIGIYGLIKPKYCPCA